MRDLTFTIFPLGKILAGSLVCTGIFGETKGVFLCDNGITCYGPEHRCDGFSTCMDDADEDGCFKVTGTLVCTYLSFYRLSHYYHYCIPSVTHQIWFSTGS